MKKSIAVFLGLILVAGAAFAVDQVTEDGAKSYSWRYKMTVTVETPEGDVSGSAVREVKLQFLPNKSEESGYSVFKTMAGEAVVVDLGERGKVFALLKGPIRGVDYGSTIPFEVFEGPPGLTIEGAEFYSALDAKKVLEPTYYPMFVTFTDINDPKTVVSLFEMQAIRRFPTVYEIKEDRFQEYFGEGVKLKSVTLEMTGEDITNNIETLLPWYAEYTKHRGYLGGKQTYPYEDPSNTFIHLSNFRREY